MDKVILKQHDTRTAIRATLVGKDGNPVDLTGCAVKFLMAKTTFENIVNRAATIESTTNGIVSFLFEANDVDEFGNYYGEFEVTFSDARRETYPNDSYITINIMRDLG